MGLSQGKERRAELWALRGQCWGRVSGKNGAVGRGSLGVGNVCGGKTGAIGGGPGTDEGGARVSWGNGGGGREILRSSGGMAGVSLVVWGLVGGVGSCGKGQRGVPGCLVGMVVLGRCGKLSWVGEESSRVSFIYSKREFGRCRF